MDKKSVAVKNPHQGCGARYLRQNPTGPINLKSVFRRFYYTPETELRAASSLLGGEGGASIPQCWRRLREEKQGWGWLGSTAWAPRPGPANTGREGPLPVGLCRMKNRKGRSTMNQGGDDLAMRIAATGKKKMCCTPGGGRSRPAWGCSGPVHAATNLSNECPRSEGCFFFFF